MRQTLIGLLLLAVGFMPVAAQSAEAETVEVVATGVGKDSDAAVKNALRAAVEQAVGALVDTETLAKNDELVSDQILTYSAGYVQSHQILGEPKTADGLVTVKIRAVVKRNELRKTLKAASIAQVTEVDGQSLFGEAITKIEQQHSAKEIAVAVVKRAFTGYPLNVMEAKLAGKPKYDEQKKQWIVPVEVSVNQAKYKEFTKGVMAALRQVAISSRQGGTPTSVETGRAPSLRIRLRRTERRLRAERRLRFAGETPALPASAPLILPQIISITTETVCVFTESFYHSGN
ncbi:hypothetical protein FACS1894139_11080 [Planctomycetales bacterium]|nr:hypothetical protein FACS1894108_15090 [Planctomycetales bacterium]GHT06063.1 hypothetical protein FACS1894139_11080 [Planctomycetales bacterium]